MIVYQAILASFCVIVVVSNILSAKLIPFFGFPIPAGLVTYPLTFLLSDLVTEIYGAKKAKMMVYLALGMSLLSFGMIQIGLALPGNNPESDRAFQTVLGLSGLRIFSSLASYLISQVVDIQLYAAIKRWTQDKHLWLRNNASTCVSQIVDTVSIDLLFLWWGLGIPMAEVVPVMVFSFAYKALFSVASTPIFYFLVYIFKASLKLTKNKNEPIIDISVS
ncbi:MAG: queuosine precursor transporter [Verrucomicrobia bacterium]|nr:queuosine precursor transporter [Verrucomicrobiota bacterium]